MGRGSRTHVLNLGTPALSEDASSTKSSGLALETYRQAALARELALDTTDAGIKAFVTSEVNAVLAYLGVEASFKVCLTSSEHVFEAKWDAGTRVISVNRKRWGLFSWVSRCDTAAHEAFHVFQDYAWARQGTFSSPLYPPSQVALWDPATYVSAPDELGRNAWPFPKVVRAEHNQPIETDAYAFGMQWARGRQASFGKSDGFQYLERLIKSDTLVVGLPLGGAQTRTLRDRRTLLQITDDMPTRLDAAGAFAPDPRGKGLKRYIMSVYHETCYLPKLPKYPKLIELRVPECAFYDASKRVYIVSSTSYEKAARALVHSLSGLVYKDANHFSRWDLTTPDEIVMQPQARATR